MSRSASTASSTARPPRQRNWSRSGWVPTTPPKRRRAPPCPGSTRSPTLSITAVGDKAVVLDASDGTVIADGRETEIDGGRDAVLQQPSAGADAVSVSTASALVRVPFDGSEPTAVERRRRWRAGVSGVARRLRLRRLERLRPLRARLRGDADDLDADIDGVEPTSLLRFRVNRDVVVLNDIIGGATWMAAEDLQRVDNWDDITPPEGETEETTSRPPRRRSRRRSRSAPRSTPRPIADDDDLGVRPGRTTVLPVLDNDSDPDGDVLTTRVLDGGPSVGDVQSINNGACAADRGARGRLGVGILRLRGRRRPRRHRHRARLARRCTTGTSTPHRRRSVSTTVAIEAGGIVTYNVLPDWIDPDGDDVFLGAVTPAEGDEADFTSDGRITYRARRRDAGPQGCRRSSVSDGTDVTRRHRSASTCGRSARSTRSPTPTTSRCAPVRPRPSSPLANDVGAGREPLRLGARRPGARAPTSSPTTPTRPSPSAPRRPAYVLRAVHGGRGRRGCARASCAST